VTVTTAARAASYADQSGSYDWPYAAVAVHTLASNGNVVTTFPWDLAAVRQEDGTPGQACAEVPAGPGRLVWDGTDDAGRPLSSGVYFAVAHGAGERVVGKVALVR